MPTRDSSLTLSVRPHLQWGPGLGYTEAGPWQYRLEVPHDPQGLKAALAAVGVDACAVVQSANTMPSIFHPGSYGHIIHEAAEMAANCWGQWELNNQPVWALQHMQIGFDTSVTGQCAQQAQYWLRKSASLFRPTPDMFPGDEDSAFEDQGQSHHIAHARAPLVQTAPWAPGISLMQSGSTLSPRLAVTTY